MSTQGSFKVPGSAFSMQNFGCCTLLFLAFERNSERMCEISRIRLLYIKETNEPTLFS
jgi:hypothetical protein